MRETKSLADRSGETKKRSRPPQGSALEENRDGKTDCVRRAVASGDSARRESAR